MTAQAGPLRKLWTLEPNAHSNEPQPPTVQKSTPNKSNRTRTIDTIALHCTAGSNTSGAYSALSDPAREASAHIIIPDRGKRDEPDVTWRLVPDTMKAWHIRKSMNFQGDTDINMRSLGIEIVNTGLVGDLYSDWQYAEVTRWCAHWIGLYPIKYIVTHSYVDPTRRNDPCDTFDWNRFVSGVKAKIAGDVPVNQPLKINLVEADGKVIPIDADAEIHEGTTWAELRPIVTALGCSIAYDGTSNTVTITRGQT